MKILIIGALALYIIAFIDLATTYGSRTGQDRGRYLWFLGAGLALHTAGLGLRTAGAGRLPVVGVDETLLFYSWVTVGTLLIILIRYGRRFVELLALPLAIVALMVSAMTLSPVRTLPLILKTYWFEIHVISSFMAYALFTVGFAGAIFYLIRAKAVDRSVAQDFIRIARIAVLWGFMLFSASMFSGAVWAYLAWGVYWMWEPKILWSFILWFWYAGMLHLVFIKERRELGICLTAIVGFVLTLFTYLGVGLLMKSSHSF